MVGIRSQAVGVGPQRIQGGGRVPPPPTHSGPRPQDHPTSNRHYQVDTGRDSKRNFSAEFWEIISFKKNIKIENYKYNANGKIGLSIVI